MKALLRRFSKLLLIVVCSLQLVIPVQVAAQYLPFTRDDVDRIVEQENFRDPNSDPTCSVAAPGTAVDSTPGPVYFVGDSIGTQVQSGLQSAFSSEGWTFQGSSLSGRTLSGGISPDGLGQIDIDQEYIRTARHIIIELGTNLSGMTTENVAAMIDKIRALSPEAQIYWIDIAVVNRNSIVDAFNDANAVIYEMGSPSQKNYKILSWAKTVFGETIDPTNMGGLADTNGYIDTRDGLNVHLTGSGISAMGALVAGLIRGAVSPGTATNSGSCTCSVTLRGDDNRQRIYFFLIEKGLTPAQAAGILGNMQAESHFEPRLVEYGFLNSRNEVSRPGEPSSLDDNVPPDRNRDGSPSSNGQPGYGIVQFTYPPFKQALRELSASRGVIAGDLSLQLEYLWSVLESDEFRSSVLDPIRAATTSDEASDIFLRRYERPGGIEEQVPIRRANAAAILAELGSLTAPSSGSTSGGGCVGGGAYPPLDVVSDDTTGIDCAAGEDVTPSGGARGYNDGRLVLIKICRVQGIVVNSQVSKQLDDMMNAATADGINLSGGAFRRMEDQISIYLGWCANDGITPSPPPYPKPPGETISCPGGGAPGYSNHQMGFAIDFSCDGELIDRRATEASDRCFAWLVANAEVYGFHEWGSLGSGRDDINIARAKRGYEAWHWSVDGN
ncbi:MAG: phage tail tip lysozyme [Candidatus Saccharibacteria bacterium]|nr:phage tail tip lysozyme [Candidatus Saccharibacteria bacterium]